MQAGAVKPSRILLTGSTSSWLRRYELRDYGFKKRRHALTVSEVWINYSTIEPSVGFIAPSFPARLPLNSKISIRSGLNTHNICDWATRFVYGILEIMSRSYPIPDGESTVELQFKNSRFIGRAGYTPTVEAAKRFIEQVKEEHAKFSHAVYAFAIGHGNSVIHGMSDAGEPSGTAGKPALAVVKGSGLGDVAVVIVRYFGGTKLGTGGLVKAYTLTAQEALAELPVSEKVERVSVAVRLPYSLFDQVKRLVEVHHGHVEEEEFTSEVALVLTFVTDDLTNFDSDLAELSNGQLSTVPVTL